MFLYYIIIRPFLAILSITPLKVIHVLGYITGNLLFIIPNRHKKITLVNLKLAFENLKNNEVKDLCKKSLIETSKTVFESGYVWKKLPGKDLPQTLVVEGFEDVIKSIDKGDGLILFTPHHANIEILINFLGKKIDCSVPFSKIKNKHLNTFVEKARSKMGIDMVDINISGLKNMLNNLKHGKSVAIASDQVPELSGGEISNFFGRPCLSMSLLWRLHSKTKAKIHSMVCIREEKGRGFKIIFSKPLEMPTMIQEGVDAMNKELEKCIMLAPEQYAWEYKKYRRVGDKDLYK